MSKLIAWIKTIHFEKGLIGLSITTILTVELAVNCVSMAILAPGDVERIGFVAMALVIVFLGLPAYLIGKRGLWVCFVVLAVFLNTSFIVESLRVQSAKANPELDYEVKRLDGLISKSTDDEAALQIEYNKATQAANMALIDGQIKAKQKERQANETARSKRLEEVVSNPVIKGSDVFVSIPRASGLLDLDTIGKMSGPIQLCFFLLMFISSQLALVAFTKKSQESKSVIKESLTTEPRRRFAHDDVSRWVSATWSYVRNGQGIAPVSRQTFEKRAAGRFDMALWDTLMAKSLEAGLIANGKIIEKDQEKAVRALTA